MKNIEMARDYAEKAEWRLNEARFALEKGNYSMCVRNSQEALEMAAKATLRYLAVEYPKEHDVGEALVSQGEKLPPYLREKLPDLQRLLGELASVRGPAMYGYEREGIPSSKAFGEKYAREIFSKVEEAVGLCMKFLRGSRQI
jgi:HEPN domain-containing protein